MDRLTDDQMQQAVASYLKLARSGTTVSACLLARKEADLMTSKIDESPQEDEVNHDWEKLHNEQIRKRRLIAADLNNALKEISVAKLALEEAGAVGFPTLLGAIKHLHQCVNIEATKASELEGELKDERSEKKEERRKMAWELILMAAKGRRIDMWIAIEAWKVVDKFNESEDL